MSPPGPIDFFVDALTRGEPDGDEGDVGAPGADASETGDRGAGTSDGRRADAAGAAGAAPGGDPADASEGTGSALEALERESLTARESLERERKEVVERQGLLTGWLVAFGLGPAALLAVIIVILSGRGELILPFFLIGTGIQLYRLAKTNRRLKKIEAELEDPIDGS